MKMNFFEMLGIEAKVKAAEKESLDERYARIDFDLGAAENVGKNIEKTIDGDFMQKIKYDGSATGCYFKFDGKRANKIYAAEFRMRHTPFIPFKKLYLSNPVAQPGKHFVIFVGGAFNGLIESSTGTKVGVTDVDGVDITPVQDKRFETHTPEVLIIKVGADFAADVISASALKIRWALMYNDLLCYIGVADVSPTNGLPIAAESYTVVDYVDLNKLYVVGDASSTRPQLNILYVEEA